MLDISYYKPISFFVPPRIKPLSPKLRHPSFCGNQNLLFWFAQDFPTPSLYSPPIPKTSDQQNRITEARHAANDFKVITTGTPQKVQQ